MRFLEQLAMRFLRNRGWVVFYLDPQNRHCDCKNGICWLSIYKSQIGEK